LLASDLGAGVFTAQLQDTHTMSRGGGDRIEQAVGIVPLRGDAI